jgi:apolipoprotein N-acyltransferase
MIFIQKIFIHKHTLLILGAAFFLCIPSIGGAEFFRWVALVPLLFVITMHGVSIKRHATHLWLIGFLFLLFQYSIYWGLLPLDWLGIESTFLGALIIFSLWLLVASVLALPFLLLLFARNNPALVIVLWPVQEFIRAVLYSVVSLGSSSIIGDTLTYGLLGYSIHTSSLLLALTPYLHLYGISALIVLINVLFFYTVRAYIYTRKKIIIAGITIMVAGLLLIEVFPITRILSAQKQIEVIALQGDNPFLFGYTQEYFIQVANHYKKGITESLAQYPNTQLVVIPEASQFVRTLSEVENKTPKTVAQELLPSDKYRILVYGDYDAERNVSLVKGISNVSTEPEYETEKRLLMPLGEYQPYIVEVIARLWGNKEWVSDLLFYRNLRLPSVVPHAFETQVGSIASVSCSEVFAGITYRYIKEQNPDSIIHLQRLASFHGDTRTFYEGLRVSKFRAAELGKPIIGAVDGSGYSYIIDAYGNVVSIGNKNSLFVHGVITVP